MQIILLSFLKKLIYSLLVEKVLAKFFFMAFKYLVKNWNNPLGQELYDTVYNAFYKVEDNGL